MSELGVHPQQKQQAPQPAHECILLLRVRGWPFLYLFAAACGGRCVLWHLRRHVFFVVMDAGRALNRCFD